MTPKGIVNFGGSYDDYLLSQHVAPISSQRRQAG